VFICRAEGNREAQEENMVSVKVRGHTGAFGTSAR
jgi:hypothetical protein